MDKNQEIINSILYKRFQTTMIGALHQFEQFFGELWGIDLPEDQLTKQQLGFSDKWELVRNNILNNGNHQLRKTIQELSNLIDRTPKHKYNLYNHKKGTDNEDKNF
jgi:hypothetical protein